jgi:hypothetical protein
MLVAFFHFTSGSGTNDRGVAELLMGELKKRFAPPVH